MKIWNCTSDYAIKFEVAGQNFIPFGNVMDDEYPSRNKFTFLSELLCRDVHGNDVVQ